MARELALGLPVDAPREMFFLPLLGALLVWAGFLLRPWRESGGRAWKEGWWLAACAGAVGVVASSGWQNTNTDRYLAWLLPVWLVYLAEGTVWLSRRLPDALSRCAPFALVLGHQAVCALWFVSLYYSLSLSGAQLYEFGKEVHAALPPGASVGGSSGVGIAYALPGRRVVHLSGLYSPDCLTPYTALNLERLKHRPGLRFDFWTFPSDKPELEGAKVDELGGSTLVTGLDGAHVRPARWEVLERSLMPPDGEVAPDGWRLADAVDVGYPEDEARCGYDVYSRFRGAAYDPFGMAGHVGTNRLFEVGRLVMGGDSMSVRLMPERPVRVVLRTVANVETDIRLGMRGMGRTVALGSPLKLNVYADGVQALRVEEPVSTNTAVFSEIRFTLPAEAVRRPVTRLSFYGDHAALGYWFYQPGP
jgi:hypothetical protein